MLLIEILAIVLPVFLVIGLGYLLKRSAMINSDFLHQANQLIYYLALPALLFYKIGTADFSANFNPALVLGMGATIVLGMLLAYGWTSLRGYSAAERGTFSQGAFRGNLAYIGLAISFYAYGSVGLTRAGILMGFLVPVLNLCAILVLLWPHRGQGDAPSGRFWARQLLLNPLILSALAGTLWSGLQWPMPAVMERTLQILTGMALPMALLAIGGSFSLEKMRGDLGKMVMATGFKLLGLPLLAFVLLRLLGVDGLDLAVGLVFAGTPAATATYIMAHQMKGDAELAGSIIMLSTLMSIFSYTLLLVLVRSAGI